MQVITNTSVSGQIEEDANIHHLLRENLYMPRRSVSDNWQHQVHLKDFYQQVISTYHRNRGSVQEDTASQRQEQEILLRRRIHQRNKRNKRHRSKVHLLFIKFFFLLISSFKSKHRSRESNNHLRRPSNYQRSGLHLFPLTYFISNLDLLRNYSNFKAENWQTKLMFLLFSSLIPEACHKCFNFKWINYF